MSRGQKEKGKKSNQHELVLFFKVKVRSWAEGGAGSLLQYRSRVVGSGWVAGN